MVVDLESLKTSDLFRRVSAVFLRGVYQAKKMDRRIFLVLCGKIKVIYLFCFFIFHS